MHFNRNYAVVHCFILLLSVVSSKLIANESEVVTDQGIQVFLTNDRGEPQTTLYFNHGQKSVEEVAFRHAVPKHRNKYDSWILEISEPQDNLTYRMAFEGALPFLIHWDGMFDNERGVIPGRRYFLRLLLVAKDKSVVSSPLTFFSVAERDEGDGQFAERVQSEGAKIFLQLTGGFDVVTAKTSSLESTLFPILDGDFGIYWKEEHRFGIRFGATSSILTGWNQDVSGNVLRYSNLEIGYRFRLAGVPPRRPEIPYVPPYTAGLDRFPKIDPNIFGASYNLEVGAHIYNTTMAGSELQQIDRELPGQIRGIALTLNTDRMLGPFRGYLGLETGFSIFSARVAHFGVGGKFVFDRWQSLSPGFYFQYNVYAGSPDLDARPGQASNSNSILLSGIVIVFKVT